VSVPSDRSRAVLDRLGATLLLVYVGTAFAAAAKGGDPWPVVALLLGSAAVLGIARAIGGLHRALVPAIVVVTAVLVWLAADRAVGGGALGGPFRYRNADGAFFVQASIAASMIAAAVHRWTARLLAIAAALPFAVIAAADSVAAGISLLVVAIALIGLAGTRAVRVSVVLAGVALALVLAGTVVLGAGYRVGGDGPLVRGLTERRLVLWHESLQIIGDHPGGVGPGRFDEVSPTAIADQDARWAHNEFLQEGVELGWAGLALVVLAFAWGFVRLWAHPRPDLVVALGAASLAALGIHACVDYVLHFPAVPLTAAALLGTAQAVPRRRFGRAGDGLGQEGVEDRGHTARAAGAPATG
jgi:O-antigen ligase